MAVPCKQCLVGFILIYAGTHCFSCVKCARTEFVPLWSPSVGEWFSSQLSITVAGRLDDPLELEKLVLLGLEAKTADQERLPCAWRLRPNSKLGPIALIVVNADTAKKTAFVEGRLLYRERVYLVRSEFVRSDSDGWENKKWKIVFVEIVDPIMIDLPDRPRQGVESSSP